MLFGMRAYMEQFCPRIFKQASRGKNELFKQQKI